MMDTGSNQTLLASVCNFGWGSLGKFRLILDKLQATEVAFFGDSSINQIAIRLLSERHSFISSRPERAAVALVINDPVAANQIAEFGVPIIYVDSLPYLWAKPEEVPSAEKVTYYCAQKYPIKKIPLSEPLRHRRDIQWIDPIVPPLVQHRGGKGIVVNVGGLHSHLAGDTVNAYLKLVLIPLIKTLINLKKTILAVCGNLSVEMSRHVERLLPECRIIGPQSPYNFERLLIDADMLITSPGSTTILQALSLKLPTILLPPQNLSQILNTTLFSRRSAPTMSWPSSVIRMDRIMKLRPRGEDAVLTYIYGSICAATTNEVVMQDVAATIQTGINSIHNNGVLDDSIVTLGSNGASQVAQLIRQTMLANSLNARRTGPEERA